MILELRRSGGMTGGFKRWRMDAGDDPSWRSLVDAADLTYRGTGGRLLHTLFVWLPGGPPTNDAVYDVWVDGRRATVRGIDLHGGKYELIDRIMREGDEVAAP
jgi:hypothetical protein